jgi:hypothetical protein
VAERKWFKGKAAVALDAWYADDEKDENIEVNLRQAAEWLQSGRSFVDLAGEVNVRLAGRDGRYQAVPQAREFSIYNPIPNGVLQGPSFEKVTRQGYLEAIGLALSHEPPVPIRTYWMTGIGNEEFEMHITDGAHAVSVTLLVPEVDGGTEEDDSPECWVVTLEGDEAVPRQVSGRGFRDQELQQPSLRGTTTS